MGLAFPLPARALAYPTEPPSTYTAKPTPQFTTQFLRPPSEGQPSSAGAPQQQPPSVPLYPYSASLWDKFEQFRNDPQLQRLVEEDLQKSLVIRQVIQDEVDRTFSHTTTLLNVLLGVLTAIPILTAAGFWFIRRSVINQVMTETRKQLQDEVHKQLDREVEAELKEQTETFKQEIQALRDEFAAQLQQLNSDAQQEKDLLIQELTQLLPAPMQGTTPELQQKLQALTRQLNALKSANARLKFTASDYLEQGRALYLEEAIPEALDAFNQVLKLAPDNAKALVYKGMSLTKLKQYAEAIASYDRATCLNPELYQAWFYKARSYALNGDSDLALEALAKAIHINPERCREAAKNEAAFDAFKSSTAFAKLVES
ncbi:MAG: tetratricopeptide repeat protein [Cyanobacteria bacterium P01_G01_bin.38]